MTIKIGYSDLPMLTNDILSNVQELMNCGADKIELLMDGQQWNEMEELFPQLALKLQAIGMTYTIHPPAWDINLTSENRAVREVAFSEYKKAIRFASMIGAEHVVIHPGFSFSPIFDKKLAQERAAFYINQLCEIANPLGVKLAIENVGYNGTSIFTQKEYASFLDGIDETAGYLIDTGHARLNNWNIPQLIKDIKNRLIAMHIHDNNGIEDIHLPIGEGTIEWEGVFSAIYQHALHCQLILEYAPRTPLEKLNVGKEILQKSIGGKRRVN